MKYKIAGKPERALTFELIQDDDHIDLIVEDSDGLRATVVGIRKSTGALTRYAVLGIRGLSLNSRMNIVIEGVDEK